MTTRASSAAGCWFFLYFIVVFPFQPVLNGATTNPAERDGRWAILVGGVSGDAALQTEYLQQIRELYGTLVNQYQFSKDQVFVLFDDVSKDPGLIRQQSTREGLARICREVAGKASGDDLLFVYILGHGSFDGTHYKLNLVGPDPSAEELSTLLYSIPVRKSIVVNTTSCSGASIKALSGPGRVVIAATKSGNERNQTRLSSFFVEALKDNNADVDKNGRVSVLEAFNYAVEKVEEYYSKEGSLQTEHPMLDDDGDGEGHAKPGPDNGDGLIARTTYLSPGPAKLTMTNSGPEQRELAMEMDSLEKQIEALKYAKTGMSEADYQKKLEELLLKLAQTSAKVKKTP